MDAAVKLITDSGWRSDLENLASLNAMCAPQDLMKSINMEDFTPPEEIDPRGWHKLENQLQQGSCQGHSLSSNLEYTYKIATGDSSIQFCRNFAYIRTQKKDGIRGDNGSTITGGIWVAKNIGLPLESSWPYTGQYSGTIPNQAALEQEASQFKIATAVRMQSYEDVLKWLQSGAGGIHIGITWNSYCTPSRGMIKSYVGTRGGGHSIALLGYDKDGNIWLANSWGTGWGDKGYVRVTPDAIRGMFRSNATIMVGVSDMATPKPRRPKLWSSAA